MSEVDVVLDFTSSVCVCVCVCVGGWVCVCGVCVCVWCVYVCVYVSKRIYLKTPIKPIFSPSDEPCRSCAEFISEPESEEWRGENNISQPN